MRPRRDFSHVQRPVGVRGIRFRSKAEANYAAYLEWLVKVRAIRAWSYEPLTFWFKGIRRGVVTYKPDFDVMPNVGTREYHEVKGYMDARSKTALARMARYFPDEKVIVIDSKHMAALKRQVSGIVPGWIR